MRKAVLALLAVLAGRPAHGEVLWQTLPPTPEIVRGKQTGEVRVNGAVLWYATIGQGPPVVLLHGGLANADWWGLQISALAPGHRVIAMDSRGHGRSTRDASPFGYDLMADDVVGLLDALHIPLADIVGWSDGAILGLDLAIRHPDRVGKVLTFAANTSTSGLRPHPGQSPVFRRFFERARRDYERLSPTPHDFDAFVAAIDQMWRTEPNWTDAQLRSIRAPVLVVDGDHDEAIRQDHTRAIATAIPGAELLILPNTSHFAFLQDPDRFNTAMLRFLDGPRPPLSQ